MLKIIVLSTTLMSITFSVSAQEIILDFIESPMIEEVEYTGAVEILLEEPMPKLEEIFSTDTFVFTTTDGAAVPFMAEIEISADGGYDFYFEKTGLIFTKHNVTRHVLGEGYALLSVDGKVIKTLVAEAKIHVEPKYLNNSGVHTFTIQLFSNDGRPYMTENGLATTTEHALTLSVLAQK